MPHRLVTAAALALLLPFSATPENPPTSTAKFNVRCPAPRACEKLEKDRLACEAGKPCDPFLAGLKQLLAKYDCKRPVDTRPIAAIWLCEAVRDHTDGTDGFGDALSTISMLNSRPALELFASPALRKALDGGYAESYMDLSQKAEHRLVAKEYGDIGGPGPYTEGGNWPDTRARASSATTVTQGINTNPAMAVDGKPFTAWCTGPGKNGVGEWIEVSLAPEWEQGKPFCAFTIIPGYTRSNASFLAHERPTRVRIASCSHLDLGFETELTTSDPADFNKSLVNVDVPPGALGGEARCVRVTILGVTDGGRKPPCISEVVPRDSCPR